MLAMSPAVVSSLCRSAIDSDGEGDPKAKSAAAVDSGEEGRGSGRVPEDAASATVEEFYDLQNYDSGSDDEEKEGGWGLPWRVGGAHYVTLREQLATYLSM